LIIGDFGLAYGSAGPELDRRGLSLGCYGFSIEGPTRQRSHFRASRRWFRFMTSSRHISEGGKDSTSPI